MNETITIEKKRYEELLDIEHRMICLENGGVDNWDWYGECMRQYREEKEKEAQS